MLLAGRAPEGTGGLGPGACGDGPREGAAPGGSAGLGGAAGLSRAPAATWCRYRDPRAAPPRRLPPGSAACCRQRSFPGRPQQRGPKALQVCKPRSRRRSAGLAGLINGIHRETNCLLFSLPSRCPPAGAGGGGAVRARSGLHPAVPSGGGAAPFKPRQRHLSSKGKCRGRPRPAPSRGSRAEPCRAVPSCAVPCRAVGAPPSGLARPGPAQVGSVGVPSWPPLGRGSPQPAELPGSLCRAGFMGISIELKLLVIP